jgi:HEAT repeat protein
MLELVAFDAPASATDAATDRERASVERDLVEAIGLLRDPRALPVLVAVLGRETEFASARTAAEALARLDSDEAAGALLAALGKASGERATAILAGMGACHRASVARALAARLAAHPDDAVARHLVRSLGQVGNAWAWKTLSERGDEAAARGAAAAALVTAFVEYGGEVRESAAKALLVVDDASTSALLEAARRGATGDVALALDDLARRVAQNPSR